MAEVRKAPDAETLIRWARGMAEDAVKWNGDRASFKSDMFFDLAEALEKSIEALKPFAAIQPVTLSSLDQEPLYAAHYWAVIGTPERTHFTREDLARARAAIVAREPEESA